MPRQNWVHFGYILGPSGYNFYDGLVPSPTRGTKNLEKLSLPCFKFRFRVRVNYANEPRTNALMAHDALQPKAAKTNEIHPFFTTNGLETNAFNISSLSIAKNQLKGPIKSP